MPIYEYCCAACDQLSSFFTRSISTSLEPICPQCGGHEMQRAISSFAHHQSTKTLHKESDVPPTNPTLDYYKDPRNVGRYVEESFKRSGMEMPDSVKGTIEAVRDGQLPKGLEL